MDQIDGVTCVCDQARQSERGKRKRETAAVIPLYFFSGRTARSDGMAQRDLCKMLLPFASVLSFYFKSAE